jgi:hypothetical protein
MVVVQMKSITFVEDIAPPPLLSTPAPFMAFFKPIGGIDCGLSHWLALAQPLPTKTKVEFIQRELHQM